MPESVAFDVLQAETGGERGAERGRRHLCKVPGCVQIHDQRSFTLKLENGSSVFVSSGYHTVRVDDFAPGETRYNAETNTFYESRLAPLNVNTFQRVDIPPALLQPHLPALARVEPLDARMDRLDAQLRRLENVIEQLRVYLNQHAK